MKTLLVLLLGVTATLAASFGELETASGLRVRLRLNGAEEEQNWERFKDFLEKYARSYVGGRREYVRRFYTFHRNQRFIRILQAAEQGTAVYGPTAFADMSPNEFRQKVLGPTWPADAVAEMEEVDADVDTAAPEAWDWREHGAVTEVKNQGQCGSCWAFSTTGNIEGLWAIKKKQLISLSEQELVDCDHVDQGCNGGLPSQAYQQIMKLGGLERESAYPYTGHGGQCSFQKSAAAVNIDGAVKVSSDEEQMKNFLYQNGPISIGVNAATMQFYFGGVAHPWKIFCNPKKLDHGVLIVAYGVTNDSKRMPYWVVKNSWGPRWGEKGYWRVLRGQGVCGLNTMATSAVLN